MTDLESKYPSEIRVVLLQAELCATQGKKEEAKTRFQEAVAKFPQASNPFGVWRFFLDQQNQRQDCESVIQEGSADQEPRRRRDLGLILARLLPPVEGGGQAHQVAQRPGRPVPHRHPARRLLLTREEVVKDPGKTQGLIDEIKSLEGEAGWQWRYEQARLWNRSGEDEFKTHYPQIVKLLQENLLANPKDHGSRLLLADTYEKANEMSLAVTTYREALASCPTACRFSCGRSRFSTG